MTHMIFDYHTHTVYSRNHHGKGTIEENVQAARKAGLSGIAITDHGPGHMFYGIRRKNLPEMRREADRLKKKYHDIEIYLGVEANITDSESGLDITKEDAAYLDFINAGYHFGAARCHGISAWMYDHGIGKTKGFREKLSKVNTEMSLRALDNFDIKIFTHPGDKAPLDMERLARACAEKGTWMEINSHHGHLTVDEIKTCRRFDVTFVIGSDAHRPEDVGNWKPGFERAQAAGLPVSRIVNIKED